MTIKRVVESVKSKVLGPNGASRRIAPPSGHAAFIHYHEERPHKGLGSELIVPRTTVIGTGPITCHERSLNLLKFYDREAA
jgi:hypothetical protein